MNYIKDINFSRFMDLCEAEDEKGIVEWLEVNSCKELDSSLNGYLCLINPKFDYVLEYISNHKTYKDCLDVFYSYNKMYDKIKNGNKECIRISVYTEDHVLLDILNKLNVPFCGGSDGFEKCSIDFVSKIMKLFINDWYKGILLSSLVDIDPTAEQINFFIENVQTINEDDMPSIRGKKICNAMLDNQIVTEIIDIPFYGNYMEFYIYFRKYLSITGKKICMDKNILYTYRYYYENQINIEDIHDPESFEIEIFRTDRSWAYRYENIPDIIECLECFPQHMLIKALTKLPVNFVYIDYEGLRDIYVKLNAKEYVFDLRKLRKNDIVIVAHVMNQLNIRYNTELKYIHTNDQ